MGKRKTFSDAWVRFKKSRRHKAYIQGLALFTNLHTVVFSHGCQAYILFDFVGSNPGLPEWTIPDVTLQFHLNQFKVRFRRFGQGQSISYPHRVNLRELHFGKLAGFIGFFQASLIPQSRLLVH